MNHINQNKIPQKVAQKTTKNIFILLSFLSPEEDFLQTGMSVIVLDRICECQLTVLKHVCSRIWKVY